MSEQTAQDQTNSQLLESDSYSATGHNFQVDSSDNQVKTLKVLSQETLKKFDMEQKLNKRKVGKQNLGQHIDDNLSNGNLPTSNTKEAAEMEICPEGIKVLAINPNSRKGIQNIIIDNLHLSCHSAHVSKFLTKDIGGLIIYSSGEINGVSFKPGYVYIQTKEYLDQALEGILCEGQIHGQLSMALFKMQPSQLPKNFLGEGFGKRVQSQMAFKSWQFQVKNPNYQLDRPYQLIPEQMNEKIHPILIKALEGWAQGAPQNISVNLIKEAIYNDTSVVNQIMNNNQAANQNQHESQTNKNQDSPKINKNEQDFTENNQTQDQFVSDQYIKPTQNSNQGHMQNKSSIKEGDQQQLDLSKKCCCSIF
eukprot:403377156